MPLPQDWSPLPPDEILVGRSFISGYPTKERLHVAYYRRAPDRRLVGTAFFGPEAEGPPGHAHGGSISGVLDEAMGIAAWVTGHPVVAAKLTVNFKTMLPLGTETVFEAWVERVEGRKVHTLATLAAPGGAPFATAEGLFIALTDDQLAGLGGSAARVIAAIRERLAR